ncbi:MAG: hypothetical protein IT443_02155 [Phycisphaeraceae bacterium]|nr:hypothetical protein [Phycisphaeraceae bacterium]
MSYQSLTTSAPAASPTPRRPFWNKPIALVAACTSLYLLGALLAALLTGNREFIFYLATMVLIIALMLLVHARVRLPAAALAALSLWGLAHMAGGLLPVPAAWPINGTQRVLYSLWLIPDYLKYDQVIHAYGFAVATWICWLGMSASLGVARPTLGLLFLAALAGMGLGALNEVVEFIATLTLPNTNVGGYVNTGWDLVANTTGATLAAILIRLRLRRG